MDYAYGQSNEYPLRILVPSDSVGAIIGKQGATIKQIKQNSHARVDVNKNEPSNNQERVIIIRGQPENCSQACREILRIMYQDAQSKNKSNEIVLKVLAHNNFIGRIIGKGGNIINTLKKDTDTNITVSSIHDLNSLNFERIISIKGELDQQIRALEMIYGRLCMANETDSARTWNYPLSQYQHVQQSSLIQPFAQATVPIGPTHYGQPPQSLIHHPTNAHVNGSTNKYMETQLPNHPTSMFPPNYYTSMFSNPPQFYIPYQPTNQFFPSHPHAYGGMVANGNGTNFTHPTAPPTGLSQSMGASSATSSATIETVYLYVPNTVIGAIIGSKGLFIKSIMKNSNASVKISQPPTTNDDQNKNLERKITISGTPEAQWKSQYYIFDKIRQEGYAGEDDVRLRAEINFPTVLIGRLVGKGGQNVRHLQQSTGATIKLPEDSQQTSASEVPIKIFGSFHASQFAQRRIQSIIQASRDPSNSSNEDSNHNNGEQSTNVMMNNTSSNNLNETLTIVNGSTVSDDAVVASSTIKNADDQKSSDE